MYGDNSSSCFVSGSFPSCSKCIFISFAIPYFNSQIVDVVLKTENGNSSSPRIRFSILLLPALVSPENKLSTKVSINEWLVCETAVYATYFILKNSVLTIATFACFLLTASNWFKPLEKRSLMFIEKGNIIFVMPLVKYK